MSRNQWETENQAARMGGRLADRLYRMSRANYYARLQADFERERALAMAEKE